MQNINQKSGELDWNATIEKETSSETIFPEGDYLFKMATFELGHSHEILTVDRYGDNAKLALIDMTALDKFIDTVMPSSEDKVVDVNIDVEDYI